VHLARVGVDDQDLVDVVGGVEGELLPGLGQVGRLAGTGLARTDKCR